MSNREAAAAITAERELLQRAWEWMADNETVVFAASESAWKQLTLIAADLRAALSAPVAAQPAASGVDALWVAKAMELVTDFGVESLRVGSHERKDNILYNGRASWETINLRAKREAAREALRAHLSTALTGAAKEE